MTDRATCWGPNTWYPPTDAMDYEVSKKEIDEYKDRQYPPGVRLEGQMEQCPNTGRYHYQFMCKTPQMRFKAVVNMLTYMDKPAHVEKAKSSIAVVKYVNKDETRVAKIESAAPIPTLFEYQGIIAGKWDQNEYNRRLEIAIEKNSFTDPDDVAMSMLDDIVALDIESGRRGAEFIAINPMWRSSWKKFWRSIIKRNASSSHGPPPHHSTPAPPCACPASAAPASEGAWESRSLVQGED